MRVLIVDDKGNVAMEDGAQIVMILRDPAIIPAMAVYPRGANVGAWHSLHTEVMAQRERRKEGTLRHIRKPVAKVNIDKMPPGTSREVCRLYFREGLSVTEIGRQLLLKTETIDRIINKARLHGA